MRKLTYNDLILLRIKNKLDKGKQEYGGDLDPNDGRDWHKEALEEVFDAMVYVAAKLIQLEGKKWEEKVKNQK